MGPSMHWKCDYQLTVQVMMIQRSMMKMSWKRRMSWKRMTMMSQMRIA
jgi:hypothetical protein